MLYGFVRLIFWGIVFIFVFSQLKKSKIVRKKFAIILTFVLCIVLCFISHFVPVENLFINFKSPQDVLDYYQEGKIDDTIHSDNSCMIIYSQGKSSGEYLIVPKSSKGYKIPSMFSVKIVSYKFDKDGTFIVYNIIGTKDYYVFGINVSNTKQDKFDIVDNNNEEVKSIVIKSDITDTKIIYLYTLVEDFTDEYFILINGKKIFIS